MDKKTLPGGFQLYREHFMFGRCNGYRREHEGRAEFLFGPLAGVKDGTYLSGAELYQHLHDCWRPVAQEEADYFVSRMAELRMLRAPEGWNE